MTTYGGHTYLLTWPLHALQISLIIRESSIILLILNLCRLCVPSTKGRIKGMGIVTFLLFFYFCFCCFWGPHYNVMPSLHWIDRPSWSLPQATLGLQCPRCCFWLVAQNASQPNSYCGTPEMGRSEVLTSRRHPSRSWFGHMQQRVGSYSQVHTRTL